MVVCQPVEIGFETDDSPVELIVGTDLAAAREYGLLGIAPTIAKAVAHVALGPGRASIAADIEAGPVEDRHNGRSVNCRDARWRRRQISGQSCTADDQCTKIPKYSDHPSTLHVF